MSTVTSMEQPGIGPRKTLFIMVTVVGCIAFLWPKVFYPMMFGGGGTGPAKNLIKDHRGSGCCDVVLNQEESYGNASLGISDKTFRKTILIVGDDVISIRQERPPHLRPDSIHPAMRERGRNIPPSSHIIPIVERPSQPPVQPRVVEGRPGPIPGMRPPMGAGSVHQAQPKASTMGFLMPMYTIAIVSFFVYTILKLVFKKPQSNLPYGTAQIQSDPHFHKQVFNQETIGYKRPDDGTTKLGLSHGFGHHHHHYIHENGGHPHDNGKLTSNCSSYRNNIINSSHYDNDNDSQPQYNNNQQIALRTYEDGAARKDKDGNEQLMELCVLRKKLQETENAMAKIIAQMGKVPSKVVTAIQGLIDAADEQFKRKENATNLSKESKEISNGISPSSSTSSPITNGHATTIDEASAVAQPIENGHIKSSTDELSDSITKKTKDFIESEKQETTKPHETGTVRILGLEMTATREDGHKWGQHQMTPPNSSNKQTSSLSKNLLNFNVAKDRVNTLEQIPVEPKPIYLEGALPHESQILVSDSEISTENILLHDDDDNDSDEPAVVLSSKMTLSLISLDPPSNDEVKVASDEHAQNDVTANGAVKQESAEIVQTDGDEHDEEDEEEEEEEEEDEPVVDKIVIEEEHYDEEENEEIDHAQNDDIKK